MNNINIKKIKMKILKVFLTLGLLTTVSFATCVQAKNEKVFYLINFDYKGKGLEKDRETLEKNLGKINNFENKTSVKELVNLYAVMQNLFKKYNIPKDKIFKFSIAQLGIQKKVQLTGTASITANASKKNILKKLLTNFNKEVKTIKITQKEFENAKDELVKEQKKEIKALEDEMKIIKSKGKNLIEIGKIEIKKIIKEQKNLIKDTSKSEDKKNLKDLIKYYENALKDDELLRKLGKTVYESTKEIEEHNVLKNMEEHIKQIKNVKYEDVIKLTKDLKIDTNNIKNT